MFSNWKRRIEVLLYCIMSLLWCCDKTPNNYLWGKLSWHARCCHWSFWALKVKIFRFISPLKKKQKKKAHCSMRFLCLLDCNLLAIFHGWFFSLVFIVKHLLIYYCWTSVMFLQGCYNLGMSFSSTLLSTVSWLQCCCLYLCAERGEVLTAAHLSWHWTSMSNLSQRSGI